MSLEKTIEHFSKHAPPGYIHCTEYAKRHNLIPQRVSAIMANQPSTRRIGPYLFVREDIVIKVSQTWGSNGVLKDRYTVDHSGVKPAAPVCRKCGYALADGDFTLCRLCEVDYQND